MVTAPQAADPARMGPLCLLLPATLLLAQVVPREASQHCGRLEYWNPDNRCCSSCLQRFGPPPCPGEEQGQGMQMFRPSQRVIRSWGRDEVCGLLPVGLASGWGQQALHR